MHVLNSTLIDAGIMAHYGRAYRAGQTPISPDPYRSDELDDAELPLQLGGQQ